MSPSSPGCRASRGSTGPPRPEGGVRIHLALRTPCFSRPAARGRHRGLAVLVPALCQETGLGRGRELPRPRHLWHPAPSAWRPGAGSAAAVACCPGLAEMLATSTLSADPGARLAAACGALGAGAQPERAFDEADRCALALGHAARLSAADRSRASPAEEHVELGDQLSYRGRDGRTLSPEPCARHS